MDHTGNIQVDPAFLRGGVSWLIGFVIQPDKPRIAVVGRIKATFAGFHEECNELFKGFHRLLQAVQVSRSQVILIAVKNKLDGVVDNSEETEVLEITSRISLKSGSRYVEVETEVNNLSCDHRLRMVFPTGFQSDSYLVSQPFGMAEFPVGRDTSTDDYNEPDEYENIKRGVVAKRDGTGEGLAVISAGGLHEAAAFPDGSLAVTMFRGFFKTVYTNGQPDGQLPGKLTFHFAVMPLRKEDSFGALQRVQDVLAAGIEASFVQNAKPELPAAESLLSITGDDSICYSTFAPSADGNAMVLRLYNPEPRKAQGKVTVYFPLERVVKARLDEVPVEEMEHSGNEFSLCLGESEIATDLLYQKKN